MSVLEKFGEMSAEYSHCADFATIYIEEAHPSEKANFSGKLGNYQKAPKSELGKEQSPRAAGWRLQHAARTRRN